MLAVEPGQLHPHLLVDCSTIDPITSQEVCRGRGCAGTARLQAGERADRQRCMRASAARWQASAAGSPDCCLAAQVAAAAADHQLHPHAAEAHEGRQHPIMIDAPVSGGVPGAQAGSLTFMVGWARVGAARPEFGLRCSPRGLVEPVAQPPG